MVEQRSPKPRAEGSSPSAPAKPLNAVFAAMAQSVERVLGKDEVGSSNLPSSSSGTSAGIQGTGAVAPVFCYALAHRRPLTGRAGKGYNGNRKTGSVQAMIELQSTQSMRVSLESLRRGEGGLDEHRASILNRVPDVGDWAKFPYEHLSMNDLAYLTAKTGHEFAILRGKREDILFHGSERRCAFDEILGELLLSKRLRLYGHSHPGEAAPVASNEDREVLRRIGQKTSRLISAISGIEVQFSDDPFEIP